MHLVAVESQLPMSWQRIHLHGSPQTSSYRYRQCSSGGRALGRRRLPERPRRPAERARPLRRRRLGLDGRAGVGVRIGEWRAITRKVARGAIRESGTVTLQLDSTLLDAYGQRGRRSHLQGRVRLPFAVLLPRRDQRGTGEQLRRAARARSTRATTSRRSRPRSTSPPEVCRAGHQPGGDSGVVAHPILVRGYSWCDPSLRRRGARAQLRAVGRLPNRVDWVEAIELDGRTRRRFRHRVDRTHRPRSLGTRGFGPSRGASDRALPPSPR